MSTYSNECNILNSIIWRSIIAHVSTSCILHSNYLFTFISVRTPGLREWPQFSRSCMEIKEIAGKIEDSWKRNFKRTDVSRCKWKWFCLRKTIFEGKQCVVICFLPVLYDKINRKKSLISKTYFFIFAWFIWYLIFIIIMHRPWNLVKSISQSPMWRVWFYGLMKMKAWG